MIDLLSLKRVDVHSQVIFRPKECDQLKVLFLVTSSGCFSSRCSDADVQPRCVQCS